MSPNPSALAPVPATAPRRPPVAPVAALAASLLTLAGCAQWQSTTAAMQRRAHEIRCTSDCQVVKEQCDDNARFQYRQCEAGYQTAQRDFRWCNESSAEECGYPWWSCSENLYGYCTNRFNECALACRQSASAPTHGGSDIKR